MGQLRRNSYQTIQQPNQNLFSSSTLSIVPTSVFGRNFFQPQSLNSNPSTTTTNVFNDRATILYRPQTSVILNDGQVKQGECPKTRPAGNGYYAFKQVTPVYVFV